MPLFVEEVTRLLLLARRARWAHRIPPMLQQSLMARLDRLGLAREVAQVGSVIGRGFSFELLRAISGMEDAPLQAALERLADADILLLRACRRIPTWIVSSTRLFRMRPTKIFSKAAARSYTVGSPKFCATSSPTASQPEPEVLAHHFTLAGLTSSHRMVGQGGTAIAGALGSG